VVGN